MSLESRDLERRPNHSTPVEGAWLVTLALGTWAALVAGIIIGLGGFADPRPWHNGFVRLMTVAATFATLIWAVRTVHPERARSLKLAVVVSLIAHTLLAVMLSRQQLEFRADQVVVQVDSKWEMTADVRPSRSHVLSSSGVNESRQDWQSPGFSVRPTPPVTELERHAGVPTDITETISPFDDSLQTRSTGLKQPLKRGTIGLSSPELLPPAASLVTGSIELPPLESEHESPEFRATEPKRLQPSSEASELARSETELAAPAPIDITSEASPAGAIDIARLRSRRRIDAAPVFSMLAESDRFAMRSPLPARPSRNRQPKAAFVRRFRDAQSSERRFGANGKLGPDIETAVERGLEFLARVQRDDGRWEFEYIGPTSLAIHDAELVSVRADAAATGLALLAMFGAGYDHFEGRYQISVQHGLDYLCAIQAPSGELFPDAGDGVGQVTRFYSHGIATLALCEAYGMTGDPQLRPAAQAAVDYLIETQHRELGGWRYEAGTNADLSVTGWQLLALRTGERAGLNVPPQVYERIEEFLDACRHEDGERALFCYNPWASPTDPRTRHGRMPSTVMTSVGILMQLQLNEQHQSSQIHSAGGHLLANLPQLGESAEPAVTGTLGNPGRDTYYWYYATQAMFRLGGESWQTWEEQLFPLLLKSQTTSGPLAGSWDPRQPVPDKWGSYGGRVYVTAMNLLSLEVANRYLLLINSPDARMAEEDPDSPGER